MCFSGASWVRLIFVFVFLFPDDGGDVVAGLLFGCDFGGWGLWFCMVVTVTVVVVAVVMVEWVLCLLSCGF